VVIFALVLVNTLSCNGNIEKISCSFLLQTKIPYIHYHVLVQNLCQNFLMLEKIYWN